MSGSTKSYKHLSKIIDEFHHEYRICTNKDPYQTSRHYEVSSRDVV